ncbi:MAG: hypothetical protein ABFD89_29325 [Bryobacteraceae bacterium]
MTVLDLIKSSLRLIHQLGPGRAPSNSEVTDALLVLNSMIEAWSIERLTIYEIGRDEYAWSAAIASRTIGPGGDLDGTRPGRLDGAGIVRDGKETELRIYCPRQWANVPRKSDSGTPRVVYNDGGHPRSTLWLWPVPDVALTLVLYPWRMLTGFAETSVEVDFPPGYADAIRYNLAVHLGEEWGRPVSDRVEIMAADKKGRIKAMNMPELEMGVDDALLTRRQVDITTGGYRYGG